MSLMAFAWVLAAQSGGEGPVDSLYPGRVGAKTGTPG